MIELHRVSKVYSVGPVKVPALREVSFRINKGEFVVLTGPSGAGKTTLLRLLYRDDLPSEGDVEVLGANLVGLGRSQVAALRRSIGVVFQDSKLLPVRTVYENVAFVLRVLGTPRREITERVFDALRVVGLSSPPRPIRPSSRRARLSARRSLGRSFANLHSSSPTSQRGISTRRWRPRSSTCSGTSGRAARPSCWPRTEPISRGCSGDGRSRSGADGS